MSNNILFDIINDIFLVEDVNSKYTVEIIKQNIFMINRILSIKYPIQANAMNIMNINPCSVLRVWNNMLYNGKFIPKWIYTKGSKKTKKDNTKKISKTLICEYCKHYGYDIKSVEFYLKISPDAEGELLEFKKMLDMITTKE